MSRDLSKLFSGQPSKSFEVVLAKRHASGLKKGRRMQFAHDTAVGVANFFDRNQEIVK